jgi:hypothetical protein
MGFQDESLPGCSCSSRRPLSESANTSPPRRIRSFGNTMTLRSAQQIASDTDFVPAIMRTLVQRPDQDMRSELCRPTGIGRRVGRRAAARGARFKVLLRPLPASARLARPVRVLRPSWRRSRQARDGVLPGAILPPIPGGDPVRPARRAPISRATRTCLCCRNPILASPTLPSVHGRPFVSSDAGFLTRGLGRG